MCIARVKASVNGNSIRNTFTDCIRAIYIVLVFVLAEIYLRIKLNFWLPYPILGINTQCKQVKGYSARILKQRIQKIMWKQRVSFKMESNLWKMTLFNPFKCPILQRDVPFLYLNLNKCLSPSVQSNIRLLPSNVQSTLKHYNKIRN